MREELILASKSPFRAQLLANAGVEAEICGANIDERAVEDDFARAWRGAAADYAPQLAQKLAAAKALEVSARLPEALIIGCDQVLELDGEVLHKAADEAEAFARLELLSGRAHRLHSAFGIARGGKILAEHCEAASMTMRSLSADYIRAYLRKAEKTVLKTVGVYQIEGIGIHLFEEIKGDYWAIIGLPLVPLLRSLRALGAAPH